MKIAYGKSKGTCVEVDGGQAVSNVLFLDLGHIKWQCFKYINYDLYGFLHICKVYSEVFPSKRNSKTDRL